VKRNEGEQKGAANAKNLNKSATDALDPILTPRTAGEKKRGKENGTNIFKSQQATRGKIVGIGAKKKVL